ncbi:MAG: single-stranded DNA-binding protein [Propionibacteriales bacterium]|nr:single-stranded DNA-binding protein [Propionibacteriales bacterium]
MSDVQVILYGYVGNEVDFKQTQRGEVATFRVGTTPRIRDGRGGFRDGETVWTTVTAWRTLAQNVSSSVSVGDPVVVIGKTRMKRWTNDKGEPRERQHVEATTVCHDLAKGTSVFRKTPRAAPPPDDEAVNEIIEQVEQGPISVNPSTGEALYPEPPKEAAPGDDAHRAA